jgi:hypothetical protein
VLRRADSAAASSSSWNNDRCPTPALSPHAGKTAARIRNENPTGRTAWQLRSLARLRRDRVANSYARRDSDRRRCRGPRRESGGRRAGSEQQPLGPCRPAG